MSGVLELNEPELRRGSPNSLFYYEEKGEGIVRTISKDWSNTRETVCMISTRCVVV